MRIETMSKSGDISLSGKNEVWVQVFSNDVHDWPSIQDKLDEEQYAMLTALGAGRKLQYYPHTPNAEEREDHGFSYEDFWVWAAAK